MECLDSMLSFLLSFIVLGVLDRLRGQKGPSRPSTPTLNEKENKLNVISLLFVLASVIYSFFLPLKLGTAWLYIGLIFYLFGMIFHLVAATNLMNTPMDRPATKGIYCISRNPSYLGGFLIFIGIGIACASWLFLLLIGPKMDRNTEIREKGLDNKTLHAFNWFFDCY